MGMQGNAETYLVLLQIVILFFECQHFNLFVISNLCELPVTEFVACF